MSAESKYLRFFAPMPTLSERDVLRFTNVDHVDRVAFVLTVADRMIAVGRFDRIPPEEATDRTGRVVEAEVAFLVQDAHQGRGIAQLLLEHLAQAGRERGIDRFVADVLPENRRMVQVFRDAGYHVDGGFEDGVMRLVFPIDTTDTSVGVMQAREHRAESASIERFFHARSVAVIGASRRHDTIGQTLVRNLVLGDYQGRVYVVNPAAQSVAGLPAYATVGDIPDTVDVAIVAVPAEAVQDVVLDCAAKGVHGLVVISSGFAETGEEGRLPPAEARRAGPQLRPAADRARTASASSTPHADYSLNASLSTLMPPRGRAGFFCQSGALGVAILEKVARRGLGLSTFVSAGNRADVSGNDLLQYWEEDDDTEVVLLYLESIGNPRKFSRLARRVSQRKPVIAVKSGRSTQGVPMGHAVRSMLAPQAAVDAMFRQAGVIQVDTLDEMFDVAQLVAHQPLPRGNRVAVVGNSDALGLLAADAAVAVGLRVTQLVALGADATAEDFEEALDAAIDDDEVDSVVAVFIPPLNTTGEEVADVLAAVGEQSDKPLVSTFLAAEGIPELLRVPDVAGSTAGRGSVPSYPAVEAAVRALARVVEYAAWRAKPLGELVAAGERGHDGRRGSWSSRILTHRRGRPRPDLRGAARAAGGLRHRPVGPHAGRHGRRGGRRGRALGWGYDGVVLKATAEHLRQRPDLAHVWRNIDTEAEMRDAWADHAGPHRQPRRRPASSCSGSPRPACRSRSAAWRTRCSGRWCRSACPVPRPSCSATGPTGSRRCTAVTPPTWSARSGRRRCCSATGAASRSTSPRSSTCCCGSPSSRTTCPRCARSSSTWCWSAPDGATVLNAVGRVEPVADARSDWFVRRLSTQAGDTLHP